MRAYVRVDSGRTHAEHERRVNVDEPSVSLENCVSVIPFFFRCFWEIK